MSDQTEPHETPDAVEPCQCVLCVAARNAVAADGPKEPRDDDDDSDDDDVAAAATCGCGPCNPKPIPEGVELVRALRAYTTTACSNFEAAGKYGSDVSRHFAALPMPPAIEAILLQFAVDGWNAADRAMCALGDELLKADPTIELSPDALSPKTLDDALQALQKMRANRPRKRGHDNARRLIDLFDRLFAGDDVVSGVGVIKVEL